MKKKLVMLLAAAAVLAVGIFLISHHLEQEKLRKQAEYESTYIVVGGVEYRRDSQALDLREAELSAADFEALQAALPDCEIRWSVPFRGGSLDSFARTITVDTLEEADLALLAWLPELQTINIENCGDYRILAALAEEFPDCAVHYTVRLGGAAFDSATETLTLSDPDAGELLEALQYLPKLTEVTLTGSLPEQEQLLALKNAFPAVTFLWDFQVCGVPVSTTTEFLDLSGVALSGTAELEAALPCFYQLTQVDMVGCGISNEEMDALNKRWPDTKFVWEVAIGRFSLRTDATYLMPVKFGYNSMHPSAYYNIRYCTDLVVVDLGHFGVLDASFVEFLPKLKYLSLNGAGITNFEAISTCTNLEYLELFLTSVPDLWPLTNLTNLKNLNLSYTPYADPTPLHKMTWLDRLWLANSRLSAQQKQDLAASLPNTVLLFNSSSSTNKGWRYSPSYYEMRDILDMNYMVK